MSAFRLGLTGSIAMGKSATAAMFAAEGLPVWDADGAVHAVYAPGGSGARALATAFPEAVERDAVSREALKRVLARDPTRLRELESLVHPLVAAEREAFLARARADIVVLNVPLLFETGLDRACDATLLVTAPPEVQRARVLARPGMTEERFALLLANQMPDTEKRGRATHIVETLSMASTRAYVQALVAHIREKRGRDA